MQDMQFPGGACPQTPQDAPISPLQFYLLGLLCCTWENPDQASILFYFFAYRNTVEKAGKKAKKQLSFTTKCL